MNASFILSKKKRNLFHDFSTSSEPSNHFTILTKIYILSSTRIRRIRPVKSRVINATQIPSYPKSAKRSSDLTTERCGRETSSAAIDGDVVVEKSPFN